MGEMVKGRVSVIIPGRVEVHFQQTVDLALERATGDIEIVAIADGELNRVPPPISDDPRVRVIALKDSIGQRAGYNLGVRESTGEYVMKIDAHAMLSPGYDEALKASCGERDVIIPEMSRLNVHTEPWSRKRGRTRFMYFGLDMYCHYWNDYEKRPEGQGDVAEVMTGQGSCWFTRREWNDHIGLLDENVGSWGNVGIEVSLRAWLCGGRQLVNKKVWQAHYFRKDEGGFPYALTGRDVARAHNYTRKNYYFNDQAFENQTRSFRWLIEKFGPIPGWEAYLVDQFTSPRVIVYYTDSQLDERLARAVRKQIAKVVGPIPIVSVSQKPLDFGENVCVGEKPRAYKSMYEQLLAGLEAVPEGSIVYPCEHDVFYHPSHFAFLPERKDIAYFNRARYYYAHGTNSFLKARGRKALSQCVCYREFLIEHCQERLKLWEETGDGGRMQIAYENFTSARPNVDIRHGGNLTPDGDYKRGWKRGEKRNTVYNLPGWGSPRWFEKKVDWQEPKLETPTEPGEAGPYLHHKFRRWLPQVSPIRIPRMRRKQLGNICQQLGFRKGAEIGVRDGAFSKELCHRNPGVELLCVDLWGAYYHFDDQYGENNYDEAVKRLSEYKATLVKATSIEAAHNVEDGSLDFVYIDADHRFDWVMEDIITWSRKVRPGGMVAGHDYYRFRNAGVVQAVDIYTQMHGIDEWFITDEKEASFFWAKQND